MSKLLIPSRAPDEAGCVLSVTPESAGWRYIGFQIHRLHAGQPLRGGAAERETCLVVLAGTADIVVGGDTFEDIGGRGSVFDDAAPGAVYAPAGRNYSVIAQGEVELAVCSAPGKPGGSPRAIAASDMNKEIRGSGTNTRYVRNILPQTKKADSLLVVEVITPGGHWSSYPPHKHDTATLGKETVLEETYYHRLRPPQGFAFQRVYTDERDLDETVCVHDGDVVLVPRGYHPVGAAHGYDLYYLNVMAGPERNWVYRNDPEHAWLAMQSNSRTPH
ncbi:MAG TPA: 5-deoxy-glucuronate isomerase [Steroidobacteraceae bacterium]|nr:5-deoxy-glucuronate isomerase [Steroidobacteraceae bacterium]